MGLQGLHLSTERPSHAWPIQLRLLGGPVRNVWPPKVGLHFKLASRHMHPARTDEHSSWWPSLFCTLGCFHQPGSTTLGRRLCQCRNLVLWEKFRPPLWLVGLEALDVCVASRFAEREREGATDPLGEDAADPACHNQPREPSRCNHQ